MAEKSLSEQRKKALFRQPKNGRLTADDATLSAVDAFCEGYKRFLDSAKTEREAVKTALALAKDAGFAPYDPAKSYAPGDRYFVNNRGKAAALVTVGQEPAANGVCITAAHIDSPRLDLKPNPLYEELELALLKTHYYGGIKKYQWTAIPLALHGVFAKTDGTVVPVSIGEREDEPCFVVNDLLPHLAQEQAKRKLGDGVRGEELNVLIGSHPFRDDAGSELVKLHILELLFEKYGVTEADFLSAELECVPAFHARDLGLDRSMIGAYGQDDRVCAYCALQAALEVAHPRKTVITVLADKEETGSDGNTGLNSAFLLHLVQDIAAAQGTTADRVLRASVCLSADVNAATDPTFADVMEKRNAAFLNYGAVLTKYTGARGKADTSDASAEYIASLRALLDANGVVWQLGELGRVDVGGGGTVAKYIANLGVDVVDLGVPVLSMHAPFETTAKFDVYMTYRTMRVFAEQPPAPVRPA